MIRQREFDRRLKPRRNAQARFRQRIQQFHALFLDRFDMVFDMIGVLVERAAEDLFAVIVIKIVERVARKTPLFKQTDHGGGIRVRLFFHLLRHGGEEMLRLFVMAHVLEIRDRMIIVFAERGEQDAANTQLAQADQLSSTAAMLISRAALYVTLNRKPEAEKDLLLALQKEPGNVDALLALNRLYRELGEADKATGVLAKAMQLVPALGDETIPGVSKTN